MNELGERLKSVRLKKNLSLAEVYAHIGITDSKLKRIEDGKTKEPSPLDLRKLADFYEINVIELFCLAKYIDKRQFSTLPVFQNSELLNDLEIEHIQNEINFLIEHRGKDDFSGI